MNAGINKLSWYKYPKFVSIYSVVDAIDIKDRIFLIVITLFWISYDPSSSANCFFIQPGYLVSQQSQVSIH